MTRSVTLVGLPREGASSKPQHYKQKVQKTKEVPKTWVLMGKQFEDFRRKQNGNFILDLSEKPSQTQGS